MKKNVIIIGAAGRDFHNFNTYYRGNEDYNVVAYTAAQIPDIDGKKYPTELAGDLYPDGIPIYTEDNLPQLIKDLDGLKKIIPLIIGKDKRREVFNPDLPDGLHTQLFKIYYFNRFDILFCQYSGRSTDRPKVEPPMFFT